MSEENIEDITKPDSSFAPTFVDHHVSPEIDFNIHCLISNIYVSKKLINTYFLHTKSMVKKFKHRFCISYLRIRICKAN